MLPVDYLISDGSSFQSRGAATLDARSPNLSLVRGTTRSSLRLTAIWSAGLAWKLAATCR